MTKPFPAFTEELLRLLSEKAERDTEPRSASEADLAGPWTIEPLPGGAFGLFRLGEHPDRGDHPFCAFPSREDALLTAAILPAVGRDPIYRLRTEPTPEGFAVESEGDVVGHLNLFNPDVTAYLHLAGFFTRSPEALARLLEATSGLTLAHVGKILLERLTPATS
jgi:hypothetical protein